MIALDQNNNFTKNEVKLTCRENPEKSGENYEKTGEKRRESKSSGEKQAE